jgi:hypothetical protein
MDKLRDSNSVVSAESATFSFYLLAEGSKHITHAAIATFKLLVCGFFWC